MDDEILVLGVPMKQKLASSREELASHCGVSVSTIARALASGKSPGKKQNGSYEIEKWQEWLAANKDAPEATPEATDGNDNWSLKKRKLAAATRIAEATAEREEIELRERRGELLDAAKYREIGKAAVGQLRQALQKNICALAANSEQYEQLRSAIDKSFNDVAFALNRAEIGSGGE